MARVSLGEQGREGPEKETGSECQRLGQSTYFNNDVFNVNVKGSAKRESWLSR